MISLNRLREMAREAFPDQPASLLNQLLAWAKVDPDHVLAMLLRETGMSLKGFVAAIEAARKYVSPEDGEVLLKCAAAPKSEGPPSGELLLSLIVADERHPITLALRKGGMDLGAFAARLKAARSLEAVPAGVLPPKYKTDDGLARLGRDLTALAEDGAFDHLCDRPHDTQRILDALSRMTKGNPVLTGPAGVGKTALVELLARKLLALPSSDRLHGTRVVEVSVNSLVAGTKYRGEFEERLENLLKAAIKAGNVVLFIDEFHLIWGAGSAEGVIGDASNILKPYLARGAPRVIGASTSSEYHRWITQDPSLERRLQEIPITLPSAEMTRRMIEAQADALAEHHGLTIDDSVRRQAILLTDRFLPQRHQPDKSVDLLDDAAVVVAREGREAIGPDDLYLAFSQVSRVPLDVIASSGRDALRSLSQRLRERVVGQDAALGKVAKILAQRGLDIGTPRQILASFLFAGATGVGKTETAKAIAAEFFHDPKALLQVDLSEFTEPHRIATLIGSPPGYRDGDTPGVLFAWYVAHKRGVILLDEIEKAHPDLQRMWLSALDEGRITNARGREMDLAQCVIVMTTNAVKRDDLARMSIGFVSRAAADKGELLQEHFPPELVGRVDETIVFETLGPADVRRILAMRLAEAVTHIEAKGHRVAFDEDRLILHMQERLDDMKGGARDIARLLQRHFLEPVSRALLMWEGGGDARITLGDAFYESRTVDVGKL